MVAILASARWVIAQLIGPGKFEWKFRYVIFKWILVIDVEAPLAKLP